VGSSHRGHSWRDHGGQPRAPTVTRPVAQRPGGRRFPGSGTAPPRLHTAEVAVPWQWRRGTTSTNSPDPGRWTTTAESSSRRAGSGHSGGSSEAVPPTPIPKKATRRSTRPHLQRRDRLRGAAGPDAQGSWAFAEAVVARSGKILEATPRRAQRRPLGPHDAAGAQTITDGSFVRIKGDDAAAPGLGSSRGSCPAIAVVASRLPDMCE
jgi:hypothetical protein